MNKIQLKPFVKWAGGKGQLIGDIKKIYPEYLGVNIKKYAEPFVGGGAVLFDILSNYELDKIYISDINAELINAYRIIREDVNQLISLLNIMQNEYGPMENNRRKEYYYGKRERFNHLEINSSKENNIEKAALFIFLNKTCFNGLYRVNKKGLFNVPMGEYKNPCICDEENLRNISNAIQKVTIICGDYKESEKFIDSNTFVYFDPPYRPLTDTSSFTSYTNNLFDDKAQIELSEFVTILDKKGAKVAVSNSDPKNSNIEDEFFDELYKEHKINRVQATRMINCNGESRGKISELLITNYKGTISMGRDFNMWFDKFKASISGYSYYIDFNKVVKNVDKLKVELNILNSLIGSKDIENEFENIINKYPETLKCIPLLLAVRSNEIYAQDEDGAYTYTFNNMKCAVTEYKTFMRKTGLFDLIANHLVNNLVDYALGVETGLDSNGRKNRGGHQMEDLVEGYIKKAGFIKDKTYFKEMRIKQIEDMFGLDLSEISNKGKTVKRFDFVVKANETIFGIETNFYASKGSKLSETARSYKQIAQEARNIKDFTFVWFTDGKGWIDAKNNLQETFEAMDTIYSIDDMENGIMNTLFV